MIYLILDIMILLQEYNIWILQNKQMYTINLI